MKFRVEVTTDIKNYETKNCLLQLKSTYFERDCKSGT